MKGLIRTGLLRESADSYSMGRPRKRCINTLKHCLRKRGLDVRQARSMVQNRSEWQEFVKRDA